MTITLQIILGVFLAPIALIGGLIVVATILGCFCVLFAWLEEHLL